MSALRRKVLARRRRVVVKLGSMVLAAPGGGVDQGIIEGLAAQMAALRGEGYRFTVVTSGAILMGLEEMGMTERPKTLGAKQALAAIGQSRLMRAYSEAFSRRGLRVGQMLLTRADLADRDRFLNARAALSALLRMDVVPVINENDTVAVEEIRFGDNDTLSSLVVDLADADLLVLLSDIEGLYDKDPRKGGARLLPEVECVDQAVLDMAGGPGTRAGSGGMATKVLAARRVAERGVATLIANGKSPRALARLLAGEELGTLFLPSSDKVTARKHWLAHSARVRGTLTLDRGAVRALVEGKKSLLPAGVTAVEGTFPRGALVRCVDGEGGEVARGVACFSSEEIGRIMGRHSKDIAAILGACPGTEVINRDDLVLAR